MPVTCTEILPDGTPGRSVVLRDGVCGQEDTPVAFAERAARRLDCRDFGRRGLYTIEVRGLPGGPARFRVRCEVVRSYRAERVEG